MDQCPKANDIINCIDKHLKSDPENLVILQEVPYMKSPIREGETRALYEQFRNELLKNGYEILPPENNALSCTLAIAHQNSVWSNTPCSFTRDYQNKYVMVKREDGLCILGIHAPTENKDQRNKINVRAFFDGMKLYADKNSGNKLIILGDMNVHSEKPCIYYDIFNSIRSETRDGGLGYSDEIKDGEITYFKLGHTLDHVLVSPALRGKVTARVISKEELQLSDHAVIIVDVNI